jgi:hypothetical protein
MFTHEDSKFSLQMVLVVLRILSICVLEFCVVSDKSDFMDLFMGFNLWNGPGFTFQSCIQIFNFSTVSVLLLPLD